MRNVAFSILLFALAVVQIAVVSTELPRSRVQVAAAATTEHAQPDTRIVLATIETKREPASF
jgi:hypothetical protein